jgi:hypothetical protein
MRRFDPVNVGLGPQDLAFCSRNPLASDAGSRLGYFQLIFSALLSRAGGFETG